MQSAMYNLSGHETNKYYLLDNNREDSYQRTHQLQVKKIIYVLSCTKCGLQYVGQADNALYERLISNLMDIRQRKVIKHVSSHFSKHGHPANDVLTAILTSTTGHINIRLRTEDAWILQLLTRSPSGLNLIQ